jgi:hypothetical protein
MQTLTLKRLKEDEYGTHGQLFNGPEFLCYTLERQWLDNKADVSCIPPDETYHVIGHNSAAHPDSWELDVSGRQGILIHSGNVLADTKGCILVGLTEQKSGVFESKAAMNKLRGILPDSFEIEIIGLKKWPRS